MKYNQKRNALRVLFCLATMSRLLSINPLFQTNWVVPRNVMCILFWTGVFVVFLGMILLVTSKHKGTSFLSWGGVILGLGLCLLLLCLMLCIHAYCVVAKAARLAETVSYSSQTLPRTGNVEETIQNASQNLEYLQKYKSKPSAVRFNLVGKTEQINAKFDSKSVSVPERIFDKPNHTQVKKLENQTLTNLADDDIQTRFLSHHSKLYPKENTPFESFSLQNMSMTRNIGTSKITVTPIQHNHHQLGCHRQVQLTPPPHPIQQGHIVMGHRPEFNPIFPDNSLAINESELGKFPLLEVGDSKATVYDNVQYYCM